MPAPRKSRAGLCALPLLMLALAKPAAATPFGPTTPIAGFGDVQAQVGGAALTAGNAAIIAGISDSGDKPGRRGLRRRDLAAGGGARRRTGGRV